MADSHSIGVDYIESLNRRFTKASVTALILFYLVLSAMSSGFARVNEAQATHALSIIKTASPNYFEASDPDYISGSWVFGAAFQAAPLLSSLPEHPTRDEALIELDRLAREWFVIRFSFLGTSVFVDLRLLAPLLPFLMLSGGSYLYLAWKKPRILERSIANHTELHAALARTRHPEVLATAGIATLMVALVAWAVHIYARVLRLLDLALLVDYACALVCAAVYLLAYCDLALADFRHADSAHNICKFEKARLWMTSRLVWISNRWGDISNAQWGVGIGLVITTLISSVAVSCNGTFGDTERAESGYAFATASWNDSQIMWLGVTDVWIGMPMRVLYRAVIVLSIAWAIFAVIRTALRWRRNTTRRQGFEATCARATYLVNALALMMAVSSVCLHPWSLTSAFAVNVVAVIFSVGAVFWAHPLHPPDGASTAYRWAAVILVLVPPGLTFGLSALMEIYFFHLVGIPMLIVGLVLQQLAIGTWLTEDRLRSAS